MQHSLHLLAHRAQPTLQANAHTVITAALVALLCVAGSVLAKDAKQNNPGTPTAEHKGLTPAYLQGDWCQTYIQFPKERVEENTPFRWDSNGTYATRTSKQGSMRDGYFYLFKPKGQVKLATVAGFFSVKSVEPNEFVLHFFSDLHFERGPCK